MAIDSGPIPLYDATGAPKPNVPGLSQQIRNEFKLIEAGIDKAAGSMMLTLMEQDLTTTDWVNLYLCPPFKAIFERIILTANFYPEASAPNEKNVSNIRVIKQAGVFGGINQMEFVENEGGDAAFLSRSTASQKIYRTFDTVNSDCVIDPDAGEFVYTLWNYANTGGVTHFTAADHLHVAFLIRKTD